MGATHSSGHGRQLGIGVVSGSHLDDVACDKVDALQTANDGTQLASGPAASLRGSGSRRNYLLGLVTFDFIESIGTHKQDQGYQYRYSDRQASWYRPCP